jgi:hypothetical protein
MSLNFKNYSVKSPSKFLGLKFLKEIKQNHYRSPKGIDYCEHEVDQLIVEKMQKAAEKEISIKWKEYLKRKA